MAESPTSYGRRALITLRAHPGRARAWLIAAESALAALLVIAAGADGAAPALLLPLAGVFAALAAVVAVRRGDRRGGLGTSVALGAAAVVACAAGAGWWAAAGVLALLAVEGVVAGVAIAPRTPPGPGERELRELAETATDLVLRTAPDGTITYASPAAVEVLGVEPAALRGRSVRELVHPDDLPLMQLAAASLRTGQPVRPPDHRMRHRDGSWRWMETVSRPVLGADGSLLEVRSASRDVSQRRVVEESLRASERKFRVFAREAPVGIFELDRSGDCVFVNRAWAGMTGLSPERATGRGWQRAVHPDDAERVRAEWERALGTGVPVRAEHRLRTAAGRVVWVAVRCVALRDERGDVSGFLGTMVDVTDRTRREAELSAIAEHSPDAMARLDRNRRFVFANVAQARWTGIAVQAFAGRTLWELALPEELVVRLDSAVRRVLEGGADEELEFEVPTPEGPRWFQGRVVGERGLDGVVEHVLMVSRDVTERREAEEVLRARDAMRAALVRGVSHEFRAPLTAIANAADALQRVDDADRRAELAGSVIEEAGRLERLVANLLDLSRLEGGALEPRMDWCAVQELVGGARRAAAGVLNGAVVGVDLDPEHPLVLADEVLTERILSNLLQNAVRHGAPPVEVRSRAADGWMRISVTDGGPGTGDLGERVFEPFVQGAVASGVGLGLALSRGFAEAQGGTLTCEHPAGGGARFTLSLPLVPVPEVPEADA